MTNDQSVDGYVQELESELAAGQDGCRFHTAAEELELSPVQTGYVEWLEECEAAACERRARLARRQRWPRLLRWLRNNAGTLKFVAGLVGMMALEVVGLLAAAHWLGLKVW